MALKDR